MISENYLLITTNIIAFTTVLISGMQYYLANKKRKDDLFTLRYAFYRRLRKVWLQTNNARNPPMDNIDLIPLYEEAYFLFGEDIGNHILTLQDKRAGNDLFPDTDFTAPFKKYLKLD